MRILRCNGKDEMGQKATSIVMDEITRNPQLLICAATGSSPLPLYKRLGNKAKKSPELFSQIRIMPLDEWIGLPNAKYSCDAFLREHLTDPLMISKERYFHFNAKAEHLAEECSRIQGLLEEHGPIDLCILGLGKNGHLGFNEPAAVLQPHCHIADLASQSQKHTMLANSDAKPTQGLTLGMQNILASKHILIIVSGKGKEQAKQALLSAKIDPQYPATCLWQHANVDCLVVT